MHGLPPQLGEVLRLHFVKAGNNANLFLERVASTARMLICPAAILVDLGVVLSPDRICKRGSSQKHQ